MNESGRRCTGERVRGLNLYAFEETYGQRSSQRRESTILGNLGRDRRSNVYQCAGVSASNFLRIGGATRTSLEHSSHYGARLLLVVANR